MALLWVTATVLASGFQVARNGLQRSVMGQAGPWGATLVRFLFGLPFSVGLAGIALALTPSLQLRFTLAYGVAAATGAVSQLLATTALLVAMRRAGFAVATALQQSSIPLAGLTGLVAFHDQLTPAAWVGVGVTTGALTLLSWPRHATRPQPVSGAIFGLCSGLAFGFALNAFRHASLLLDLAHPILAAVVTVAAVQAMQTIALGGVLLIVKPQVVAAALRTWRHSMGAGLCGSLASTGWFIALALAPAASVRAVGVVEAPMAAFAGRRLFGERLSPVQIIAGVAVAVGVVLTARG
jgi:drug/metabolite transporter (DMT)-like permease